MGSDLGDVRVSVRRDTKHVDEDLNWATEPADSLAAAAPWRAFRWYKGQQHYSGAYWSATTGDHVLYESRLELTRVLYADMDPQVTGIVGQPFLLKARVDGAVRRHIPDYLLLTSAGPVVVDVKPRHRLENSKVAFTFSWTREAVETRGWRFEVWSEPPAEELSNVRFLAGYRRAVLFDPGLLAELRSVPLAGMTIAQAERSICSHPTPIVRAALLHLVWSGDYTVALQRPLRKTHLLEVAR